MQTHSAPELPKFRALRHGAAGGRRKRAAKGRGGELVCFPWKGYKNRHAGLGVTGINVGLVPRNQAPERFPYGVWRGWSGGEGPGEQHRVVVGTCPRLSPHGW